MKKMGLPTMLINSYDDLEEEVCGCEIFPSIHINLECYFV